jgi:hypothetical protein
MLSKTFPLEILSEDRLGVWGCPLTEIMRNEKLTDLLSLSSVPPLKITAMSILYVNNISLQYVLILSRPVFALTLTLTILGRCIPLRFPIFIEVLYIFLACQGSWDLSNRNGAQGVKAGRCIVAFMIFNFLVYKCPKTGLNFLESRPSLMRELLFSVLTQFPQYSQL